MSTIHYVPLDVLSMSSKNIRRTQRDQNIEAMAASILAEGLLQNLTVARIPPDEDQPAERFEVIAGGRRLRAMQLLRDRDQLPDALRSVPVNIVSPEIADEVGLAENTIREKMHPHDEFVAFRDLAAKGTPIEDIAARFGVTPLVVERRLKLANVAPEILHAFRLDKLSLEVMQAFALTDDWAVQLRIFEDATSNGRRINADQVRRALTQREVSTTDRRVKFVGLSAYEQAGGAIRRDLFANDGGGYCLDETLLDQLVEERLQNEAKLLEAAGWKFVQIEREGSSWKFTQNCNRSQPKREKRALSDAEQARLKEIADRISVLSRVIDEADEGDGDSDVNTAADYDALHDERETLQHESDELTSGVEVYTDRQKASAGCLIQMGYHGELEIERGLIPREGTRAESKANAAKAEATGTKPEPKTPTLAEAMIRRLTAHRTLALQSALLANRDLALKTLVHGLLLPLLYDGHEKLSPLNVTVKDEHKSLSSLQFVDVDASPVMRKLDTDIEEMRTTLGVPTQRAKLWPWLLQQNAETVQSLLALVAVVTLNATSGSIGPNPCDPIAAALDIDYADYWQATPEAFTNLVSKAIALEALGEVDHDGTQLPRIANSNQKKDVLAAEVAQFLVRWRWLPKPLRRPGYKPGSAKPAADTAVPVLKATKKPVTKATKATKPAPKKKQVKKAVSKPKAKKG